MKAQGKQTIFEHLTELRSRLIKSVIALVVGTGISAGLAYPVLQFLKRPAGDVDLVYIYPTEFVSTYFKVAVLGGFILAMPVILYQIAMFVAPGLTSKEKRYVAVSLPVVLLCFAAGVFFTWFVLLPPALGFLLNPPDVAFLGWVLYGGDVAEPQIRISGYIDLILMLSFWMGVSFQTPLLMLILARLGIVSPKGFARKRKFAVLGAFVAGAIFTPTIDPLNQTLLASPIIVLYEVGIWLSKLAAGQRRKAADRATEALETMR